MYNILKDLKEINKVKLTSKRPTACPEWRRFSLDNLSPLWTTQIHKAGQTNNIVRPQPQKSVYIFILNTHAFTELRHLPQRARSPCSRA